MKESMDQDAYWAAYNEASSELDRIENEVERLRVRRERVEKLVEVLKRRFGYDAKVSKVRFVQTSELPGLSIRTKLVVVETKSRA